MSTKKDYKVWAVSTDGAGFMVTPESAVMRGNSSNFIAADKNGISLSGKGISFVTTSESIRHGGLFVQMNDFVRMIPSTLVTPIPPQIPWPPLGMVGGIIKDLPFFIAMLAVGVTVGVVATNAVK